MRQPELVTTSAVVSVESYRAQVGVSDKHRRTSQADVDDASERYQSG